MALLDFFSPCLGQHHFVLFGLWLTLSYGSVCVNMSFLVLWLWLSAYFSCFLVMYYIAYVCFPFSYEVLFRFVSPVIALPLWLPSCVSSVFCFVLICCPHVISASLCVPFAYIMKEDKHTQDSYVWRGFTNVTFAIALRSHIKLVINLFNNKKIIMKSRISVFK